jgi:hypothetical protein
VLALVSADERTPGAPYVDVFVPNGVTYATFYVQALEDTTGTIYLTATAPGFTAGIDSIDVVQPSLRINGLLDSQDPVDPDDTFTISVGIANGSNTALSPSQKVRVGGSGLTATISNSNAAAGELVTMALTAQVVSVTISPGESTSSSTVAAGGVAFSAIAPGTTDVEATIPGFNPLNDNPQTLTVIAPTINMSFFPADVGDHIDQPELQRFVGRCRNCVSNSRLRPLGRGLTAALRVRSGERRQVLRDLAAQCFR